MNDSSEPDGAAEADGKQNGLPRRSFIAASASAVAGGVIGWFGRGALAESAQATPAGSSSPDPSSSPELPDADRIRGITAPAVPQRYAYIVVVALAGVDSDGVLRRAADVAAAHVVAPADAGEITVTVGFSPAHAKRLWPDRAARAQELPSFAHDTADIATGGDLLLQICAETDAAAHDAWKQLRPLLGTHTVVWSQTGFRDAPTPAGTTRTSSGFIDGIMNPRTAEAMAAGLWTGADHRDTHVVVRRMPIDPSFGRLPTHRQERAIGRHKDTGAPLSGGGALSEIDLFAKTADGHLKTPNRAHVRRAHPANIGRALMLRRSYSFSPAGGAGLIFIAFMADPTTFIRTQRRLDEVDDFLAHTTIDASGCFFVPEEFST